ncbi:hypothetical protein GALMADRAFT_269119 [Galerina marginata CBS 339.88]|uniref:DUF4470 domain-containing protein n=1 Tax=Galerina marginata (strain CBS 339.88) TaxID=685588 RepID=A0A067SVH8_GALM3|nr:hypothetical protein GALMADRAFT_269119 [Galerina marginata CBS 339.88]
MAESISQKGNVHYTAGQLVEAQKCYETASLLEPTDPKYASNLSAVLYEQGRYKPCIKAIFKSWLALKAKYKANPDQLNEDVLAFKIATRFAKAKINAAINGKILLHASSAKPNALKKQTWELDLEPDIQTYVMAKKADPKAGDLLRTWERWEIMRDGHLSHSPEQCKANISEADSRLRALPIFRLACDPENEFFVVGHDEVHSLLDGVYDGSLPENTHLLKLRDLTDKELGNLSFLFGGSGDARHIFGTLLHISQEARELPKRQAQLKVHMLLVDIHPAALARVVLIFELLWQILLSENSIERLELKATLFFLYLSVVMPEYCHKIIVNSARVLATDLRNKTHRLSDWIHLNEKSLPRVVEVLEYWSTALPKSTQILIKMQKNQRSIGNGDELYAGIRFAANSGTYSVTFDDPNMEHAVYDAVKILLPPKPLLSRHPALCRLVDSNKNFTPAARAAASQEIERSWHPNPTFFDKHSTENPNSNFSKHHGYPVIPLFPQRTLASANSLNIRFGGRMRRIYGKSAFGIMSTFFDLVASSMQALKPTIEVVLADVITVIPRLVSGELGHRPDDFPSQFIRMWLSNVPDYTNGIISTAVHLLPHLHLTSNGLFSSNCLLNTGAFVDIAAYCYNYTLLLPQDLPRFLGCELICVRGMASDDIHLKTVSLPLSAERLASKAEVHRWLSHLLLCALCPSAPAPPPFRVDLPYNVVGFFHILNHLHWVGYPSHWLGDFVQMMVSDSLVTEMNPYDGVLPVPPTEFFNRKKAPRKVHLQAWSADVELILAQSLPALPYSVTLPKDFAGLGDVRTYKAIVRFLDLRQYPRYSMWHSLSSPFCKTVGLMFYKPDVRIILEELVRGMGMLIEGDHKWKHVQVQFMQSVEGINILTGQVSWKMSKVRYTKMRSEGWKLAVYRTDIKTVVNEPLPANWWLELE